MPSPVGHALGGLVVALVLAPRSTTPPQPQAGSGGASAPDGALWTSPVDRRLLWAGVAAACLPDLDFLWGRHNLETHSLGFALVVGLVAWGWTRSTRWALVCALAVATHVLFDWLGSDTTPPLGVMALWPMTSDFYFADAFVFEAISRRYWLPNFVQHNLMAVAREIALLLPLTAVVWWRRARR